MVEEWVARVAVSTFFFILLGTPSWIDINSIYLQLPIFMEELPEGYTLPSYISLAVQLGNIFPILYIYLFKGKCVKFVLGSLYIFCLLVTVSAVFVWDLVIGESSVGLLVVCICSGAIGSMFMVTLFSFASTFPSICTTSVSIGLSMSGLLPILLALPQHPGTPQQTFSVNVYFSVISLIVAFSLLGYVLTVFVFTSFMKRGEEGEEGGEGEMEEKGEKEPLIGEEEGDEEVGEFEGGKRNGEGEKVKSLEEEVEKEENSWRWITPLSPLLGTIGWTSLLKYWLLGLSTYSLVCYTRSASLILWMNVTAFTFETIGRSLTFFITSSFFTLRLLILSQTVFWAFLIIAVFLGEHPLLPFSGGGWVIISGNSLYAAMYGLSSTMHFLLVGEVVGGKEVAKGCQYVGLANQVGAFFGAVVSFLLVSYLDTFVDWICE